MRQLDDHDAIRYNKLYSVQKQTNKWSEILSFSCQSDNCGQAEIRWTRVCVCEASKYEKASNSNLLGMGCFALHLRNPRL